MRNKAAHLTVVVGEPSTADVLRQALTRHGVDHAAVVAHVNSIRRSLVLGESDFVVLCIALDWETIKRHGRALRSLFADHRCFPTAVRTIGMLTDLGFTREVAELGCDVYVDDSEQAAQAIRLLEDAWTAEATEQVAKPAANLHLHRWRIGGGWMFGSPNVPDELTSLIPTGLGNSGPRPLPNSNSRSVRPFQPRRIERTGSDFGDPSGLQ